MAASKGTTIFEGPRGSPVNTGSALTAVHPVVRTHPITGWKGVFALGVHCHHINDVTKPESDQILQKIHHLVALNPDLQVRFRWEYPHDIGKTLTVIISFVARRETKHTMQQSGTTEQFIMLQFRIMWESAAVGVFCPWENDHTSTPTACPEQSICGVRQTRRIRHLLLTNRQVLVTAASRQLRVSPLSSRHLCRLP